MKIVLAGVSTVLNLESLIEILNINNINYGMLTVLQILLEEKSMIFHFRITGLNLISCLSQ